MEPLDEYQPETFERTLYRRWRQRDAFVADPEADRPAFSMVIPPPNVTGSLHMGHALNSTLQDVLARWKRMQGHEVLWVPGTDHAGIATQNVVERQLAEEGTDRHELGREAFLERVWEWKQESGDRIVHQLQELGVSCDWSRERFTMDEGLSEAVREVFVRLYEDDLIYQGDYIVNWCPRCETALSDIEVEHETVQGHWYHIDYPRTDGEGALRVATTRPETMLGDTAVAYHPRDDRYEGLEGTTVHLPLTERDIPVIADDRVDPEFGSGLVKVTPAHDDLDFRIGEDHGLERINLLNPDGTFNEAAGEAYAGLDRFEVRDRVVQDLRRDEALREVEDYAHEVGHCYRCDTPVEPYVSRQWFVAMKPLAEPAIEQVREGEIQFHPDRWENTYFEWMENIRDWCISRQIWWGHRIPVWYGPDDEPFVARSEEAARRQAVDHYGEEVELERETDVLDTWFSSALWPFSTLGWPDETPELEKFYPTDVLSTAFDIIYFWVARMIMMGNYCTGEEPFGDVYIHALVRDEDGLKMSKSRGNVIDPLEVIEDYGCDALRFTFCALAAQGRDIRLSTDRIEGFRNFCNKVWNAARFVGSRLDEKDLEALGEPPDFEEAEPLERWILSRYRQVVTEATGHLENYDFDRYANVLYQFFWHEYCDWYIEMAKLSLDRGESDPARIQRTLYTVLEGTLRALHPAMPFLTEKIRNAFGVEEGSIVNAPWPRPPEAWTDPDRVEEVDRLRDVIRAGRHLKKEFNVQTREGVHLKLDAEDERALDLREYAPCIRELAGLASVEIDRDLDRPAMASTEVLEFGTAYLPLEGLIDVQKERTRIEGDLGDRRERARELRGRLDNPDFLENAPEDVVQKAREDLGQVEDEIQRLEGTLAALREDAAVG